MEALSYTISMALFGVILAETAMSLRARRALRGSHERFVALTWRRILSWTVNIGFAVQGIVGLALGQPFSLISLLFAVYLSYMEIKNHKNDDDWFTGRGKKILKAVGRGLRRAAGALRPRPVARPPVRVPLPSPVFG